MILYVGESCIARAFKGHGSCLRQATEVVHWPLLGEETHVRGGIYAGFTWQLIQELKRNRNYSKDKAFDIAKHLILEAAKHDPASIEEAVRWSFEVDDDDQNQLTCSPHNRELRAAANSRRIPIPPVYLNCTPRSQPSVPSSRSITLNGAGYIDLNSGQIHANATQETDFSHLFDLAQSTFHVRAMLKGLAVLSTSDDLQTCRQYKSRILGPAKYLMFSLLKTNQILCLITNQNRLAAVRLQSFINGQITITYQLDNAVVPQPRLQSVCKGFSWNNACWYTGPRVNMSCNEVCADKGGFNVQGSVHQSNHVGRHFWPSKGDGWTFATVECSSTDNNLNFRANGQTPDGNWRHYTCFVHCACNG